jgi:hypothetical protein
VIPTTNKALALLRATLVSYDSANHEADVVFDSAPGTVLTLPVATACPGYHLTGTPDLLVGLWPDRGGLVLGPTSTAPGSATIPGALTVEGAADIEGALAIDGNISSQPGTQQAFYVLGPNHKALSDDTYTDLITFTKSTGSFSARRGEFWGLLLVASTGDTSGGSTTRIVRAYLINVSSAGTANMILTLQQLGTDITNTTGGAGTQTLTVDQKSTSQTSLTVQAKTTYGSFSDCYLAAFLIGFSMSTYDASHMITPELQ